MTPWLSDISGWLKECCTDFGLIRIWGPNMKSVRKKETDFAVEMLFHFWNIKTTQDHMSSKILVKYR